MTIDVSSIDTGVADRDAHLKSPDFFDVAQYPELRFVGKRVESQSRNEIDLVGDLTIKGVTRKSCCASSRTVRQRIRGAISARRSLPRRRSIARTSGSPGTKRSRPVG